MGLHLNYELRLPMSTSADDMVASLTRLHSAALSIPFKRVSAIFHAPFGDGDVPDRQSAGFRFLAAIIAQSIPEIHPCRTGELATAAGFIIDPGDRCETASVGFMRTRDERDDTSDWFWHCSCKTQYASVISDRHLLACHTGLVQLLDCAIASGVHVVVRDEAHYWETRDDGRLITEVRAMNQVVARIAGQFSDAIGPGVGSPLFAHPEFERLEMGDSCSMLRHSDHDAPQ